MTLKYYFGEDYFIEDFEYELEIEQKEEVAKNLIADELDIDTATAKKVAKMLFNYDFIDGYLEDNIEEVKEYFREDAFNKYLDR